jgi:hypothetical protein
MKTKKKMLSEKHSSTLISMINFTFILKERGQNAEVIKLMEKYVQLRTRILDINYFYILSSSATLIGWQIEKLKIDVLAVKTFAP